MKKILALTLTLLLSLSLMIVSLPAAAAEEYSPPALEVAIAAMEAEEEDGGGYFYEWRVTLEEPSASSELMFSVVFLCDGHDMGGSFITPWSEDGELVKARGGIYWFGEELTNIRVALVLGNAEAVIEVDAADFIAGRLPDWESTETPEPENPEGADGPIFEVFDRIEAVMAKVMQVIQVIVDLIRNFVENVPTV